MDKEEALKIIMTSFEKEADRTWSRNNAFLIINAGALSIIAHAWSNLPPILLTIAGIGGIAICCLWRQAVKISGYHELRWLKDAEALLLNNPEFMKCFQALSPHGSTRIRRPKGPGARKCIIYLTSVFIILWLILLMGSIFRLLCFIKAGC